MRNEKGQFVKGYTSQYKGEKSPTWKGGLPTCEECGTQLSVYGGRWCVNHRTAGENNGRWKGGYTKAQAAFHQRRREAAKKASGGSHTLEQWEALKQKYNFMCLCCKAQEPFVKLTEDHIVPISRGGTDDITNIQPLCLSCNCRKLTKTLYYTLFTSEIELVV